MLDEISLLFVGLHDNVELILLCQKASLQSDNLGLVICKHILHEADIRSRCDFGVVELLVEYGQFLLPFIIDDTLYNLFDPQRNEREGCVVARQSPEDRVVQDVVLDILESLHYSVHNSYYNSKLVWRMEIIFKNNEQKSFCSPGQ